MPKIKYLMPYISGLFLFGVWAALVFKGLTPSQPFVDLLSATIGGAGVHVVHISKKAAAS